MAPRRVRKFDRRLDLEFAGDRFSERTVVAGAEPNASPLRSHLRRGRVGGDCAGLQALWGLHRPTGVRGWRARGYQKWGRRASSLVARSERARLVSASVVDSEVVRGLVVCLSRRSQAVGAGRDHGPLGALKGAGDPGAASRAGAAAAAIGSASPGAGRSRLASCAQSITPTPGVAGVLGQAGDVAALAPSAGGAALDVSTEEAGTAAAGTSAAGLDRAPRARTLTGAIKGSPARSSESGLRSLRRRCARC